MIEIDDHRSESDGVLKAFDEGFVNYCYRDLRRDLDIAAESIAECVAESGTPGNLGAETGESSTHGDADCWRRARTGTGVANGREQETVPSLSM